MIRPTSTVKYTLVLAHQHDSNPRSHPPVPDDVERRGLRFSIRSAAVKRQQLTLVFDLMHRLISMS